MPQKIEEYLSDYNVPPGSRAKVNLYFGSVCPVDLSFGYIHGESPNRGEMKYEEDAVPPLGRKIAIQCGYHSYIGLTVRSVKDNDVSTGNCRSLSFVDMRDRLHDVIHYAQWNMTDDDKFRIFHIFPWNWSKQKRTYINQVEKKKIVNKYNQNLKKMTKEKIEVIEQVSPFSAKSILNYLGETFNFKITATEAAMNRLETYYPDNLDFNSGVKVINCISTIIDKVNLQFTCYGDLTVHITMKGVAENEFDRSLLAGTINLCNLPGYKSAQIGSELNERGRRVNIVGGRNRYERWYPLYPAWNLKWDGDLVLSESMLTALLIKNNIAYIQDMFYLPDDYAGPAMIYGGANSHYMSIREYLDNIPFKVFDVDFSQEVFFDEQNNEFVDANGNPWNQSDNGLTIRDGIRDINPGQSLDTEILDLDKGKFYRPVDSEYPISSQTVSSYKDQFKIFGTNTDYTKKGADIDFSILQGVREELKDVANLESYEVLELNSTGNYIDSRYKARFVFNRRMFRIEEGVGEDAELQFRWDHLFVKLSTDREVFTYDVGDAYGSPRVRPIVKNVPDLYRSFYDDGTEDKADTYDVRNLYLVGSSDEVQIPINDIAKSIAETALLHEFISSNGNIVFKKSCGFLPSGIIESVAVSFDAKNGIQETTNFTNSVNNEQTPVYRTNLATKRNALNKIKGDGEGNGKSADDPLVKEALDAMQKAGAGGPGGGNQAAALKPSKITPEANFNTAHHAQNFGGLRNAAIAEIELTTMIDDRIRQGEILILNEPPA